MTGVLDDKFRARERGLADARKVIRASANAIRALHRGEDDDAARLMDEAGSLLSGAAGVLADHPDVLHAGFFHDAAKEYAEARLTAALGAGEALPLPADLGVEVPAYLNGLGEAVGEMRRRMLDLLRAGDLAGAERILEAMDSVVELLASLDYPDGMTGGLRRTTDVARSLVERSRSDLTTTVVQERLRNTIEGNQ
ncbi:MAG TPA: haloacid dehalogenase [Acidimicrobiia bacterium]|nr:haloacid dehalogenase [Acidimicrobiia bacterium]